MKYPIGIQDFEGLRSDGYVYVDKTALIYQLVTTGKYYFLSRPRRFGKSLLLSTLEAYFKGKRQLFQGLEMERLEKQWITYPVVHLDLNTGKYATEDALYHVLDDFLHKLEDVYGSYPSEVTLELRFKGLIERIAKKHGQRVVVLVDEYDKPLLQNFSRPDVQDRMRDTLKAFYSVLKTQDRFLKFAFFTGVTKFGKISVFSDLNNLVDLSMDNRFETICGITAEEMRHYFHEGIMQLADYYHVSVDEISERLRKRYDGYHFVENSEGVYNPYSLLSTLSRGRFGSYWFETGTPTFLVKLLQAEQFCLPDLTRQEVSADFINSIDSVGKSPIPIIYQSGYLTIKDYDERFGIYTLGFPNEEVEEGFTNFLLPYYTHIGEGNSPMFISTFVRCLEKGEPQEFMRRMETMFSDTDYRIVGDAELYFQNAFYLITKLLGFYVTVEKTLSDGRIDMVCKTRNYIYLFEFKYDKTAKEALRQIKEKGYDRPYATDKRKLYKVGVNFSRKKRCIDDWAIEV